MNYPEAGMWMMLLAVLTPIVWVMQEVGRKWLAARRQYYIGRYETAEKDLIEARDERDRALNRNLLDRSLYAKEMEKQINKHDFEAKRMLRDMRDMTRKIGALHKEIRLMGAESRE
jgi:hypothetical protein